MDKETKLLIKEEVENLLKKIGKKTLDVYINPAFCGFPSEAYKKELKRKGANIIIYNEMPVDVRFVIRQHYELADFRGKEIEIKPIKIPVRPISVEGEVLY